jgi:glutamate synthase domain-containing protein 2
MCEIGKSAYRGHEVIYPQPFGLISTASEKDYPLDYSHFSIMGTTVGAVGIEPDSNKAIFSSVNIEAKLGRDKGIKLRLPVVIPAMGSTHVAAVNWEGLAVGAALSGIVITIGENVCGMDPASEIRDGKIVKSPELARRVKLFQEWQIDGYGEIVLQANVEDTGLGVQEYALRELGVRSVEIKWGQGAKDIGGEVKINDLERAVALKQRGYIVLPDPENPVVAEEFRRGAFKEFERHSRVGMVDPDSFARRVESLREAGAKYIFLKTGAYRPADLARAVKYCSANDVDVLTVDGAGGGTGMSPWRMMNEWGIPPVELHSLAYRFCEKLAAKGEHVPDLVFSGGFTMEDQLFKGLALGAPFTKCIGMARAPLAAAMVAKTIGVHIDRRVLPVYIERFGKDREQIFVTAPELKHMLGGERFQRVPTGALGVFTFCDRLSQGLRQIMCGNRKFGLEYIARDDIAALTSHAAGVSGISYVMDMDCEEIEMILGT